MFRKKSEIVLAAVCALLAFITVFLLTLTITFSLGKGAPNIFGKTVYLVKTDAFELIKNPSAVVAEKAEPADIVQGNIVIFALEDGGKAIGEVREKTEEGGVTFYTLADENGVEHTVGDGAVIAKAMKTSGFMGALIAFATSSAGMLIIVIIPCLTLIAVEAVKPLLPVRHEVDPVNKQDETPTFVPKKQVYANARPHKPPENANDVSHAPEKNIQPQLFNIKEEKPKVPKPAPKPPQSAEPSSVKLAKTISLVKSEKENTEKIPEKPSAAKSAAQTKSIEEILAIYAGRKGEQ